MSFSRRRFLHHAGAVAAGAALRPITTKAPPVLLKPPRLKPGDTVGIVAPAGAVYEAETVREAAAHMEALGLRVKLGAHVLDQHGYLAGTDEARAADLNAMFADPDVRGILGLRGGWGCARILPLIDYDRVRADPKVVFGFSDITALLLALYVHAGLVTLHGPTGVSTWNAFTVSHFRRVAFDAEAPTLRIPDRLENGWPPPRVVPINPGTTRGRLAGGNLSVLAALVGTPYLPDWDGHVLFLEDIGEDIYRIDRMLTHLRLAGVLSAISGFIFGQCSDCEPGTDGDSLTLDEVFADHLGPLGIPAWYGSMIGHIRDKFTVPVGIEAEIDATAGTIRLLEAAVQ